MVSISVLTLSSEDIKEHLKCDEKRVHQIMGMAARGKFADSLIDSFWQVIDDLNITLESEDESIKKVYEKIGKELEA